MRQLPNSYQEWVTVLDPDFDIRGHARHVFERGRELEFYPTITGESVAAGKNDGRVLALFYESGLLILPNKVSGREDMAKLNNWVPADDAILFEDTDGRHYLNIRYFQGGEVAYPLIFWDRYDDLTTLLPTLPDYETL